MEPANVEVQEKFVVSIASRSWTSNALLISEMSFDAASSVKTDFVIVKYR